MALVKSCRGKNPQFGNDCYLAENATIVGDVTMGNECSVWFNAVIRGDVNAIKIGNKVNIQDGAVIHCTMKNQQLPWETTYLLDTMLWYMGVLSTIMS